MCRSPVNMDQTQIQGNAILCFDEDGVQFQGVIHAKDDTQYAVYGTKSTKPNSRRWSENENICGCTDEEVGGGGVPVTYDIRIVDCEVGNEYSLKRVHGRNGEEVTLRCKEITFQTTQMYRGQRADMEAQRVIGHKMEGRRGIVYKGPISALVSLSQQSNRPWVL